MLTELGNALSALNRVAAVQFVDQCYKTPNIRVVPVDTSLFRRAVELYRSRQDKEWGLTDCISFVTMEDEHLLDALTADRHFSQAGFRAVMRRE